MSKSQFRFLVGFGTVVCALVFVFTLIHSAIYVSSDETDTGLMPASVAATTTYAISSGTASSSLLAGIPSRLRIPSLGVDAVVQHVGIGKTGNMAVPSNYTDAGWYRYGPEPGQAGSAVLDGHVDNGLGLPGVFFRLKELAPGDSLYIDTEAGNTLHFVVESAATYALADVPRDILFTRADQPRLNLITCEGAWNEDQKMYDERHVVYAVLAP